MPIDTQPLSSEALWNALIEKELPYYINQTEQAQAFQIEIFGAPSYSPETETAIRISGNIQKFYADIIAALTLWQDVPNAQQTLHDVYTEIHKLLHALSNPDDIDVVCTITESAIHIYNRLNNTLTRALTQMTTLQFSSSSYKDTIRALLLHLQQQEGLTFNAEAQTYIRFTTSMLQVHPPGSREQPIGPLCDLSQYHAVEQMIIVHVLTLHSILTAFLAAPEPLSDLLPYATWIPCILERSKLLQHTVQPYWHYFLGHTLKHYLDTPFTEANVDKITALVHTLQHALFGEHAIPDAPEGLQPIIHPTNLYIQDSHQLTCLSQWIVTLLADKIVPYSPETSLSKALCHTLYCIAQRISTLNIQNISIQQYYEKIIVHTIRYHAEDSYALRDTEQMEDTQTYSIYALSRSTQHTLYNLLTCPWLLDNTISHTEIMPTTLLGMAGAALIEGLEQLMSKLQSRRGLFSNTLFNVKIEFVKDLKLRLYNNTYEIKTLFDILTTQDPERNPLQQQRHPCLAQLLQCFINYVPRSAQDAHTLMIKIYCILWVGGPFGKEYLAESIKSLLPSEIISLSDQSNSLSQPEAQTCIEEIEEDTISPAATHPDLSLPPRRTTSALTDPYDTTHLMMAPDAEDQRPLTYIK